MNSSSVFVCEPQPIVVEGLRRVFDPHPDLRLVGSAGSASPDTVGRLTVLRPDIVLLSQTGSLKQCLQTIGNLKTRLPETHSVLWVDDLPEPEFARTIEFGASGVLRRTQPIETLIDCLRAVVRGSVWIEDASLTAPQTTRTAVSNLRLTPRELDVLTLVCRGYRNRDIADELEITPGTVKVHIMHLFEKAGVNDRLELAAHGHKLLNPVCRPVVEETPLWN